jgi:hypothetical protein
VTGTRHFWSGANDSSTGLFSIHRVLTHERRHHDVPPLKERRMFWFR